MAAPVGTNDGAPAAGAGVVLLVDDDELVRRSLGRTLRRQGFAVVQAESAEVALDHLRRERVDVLLTDVHLPGISGVELLERVPRLQPSAVMLVFTGMGDIQIANASLERGAADYFEKPIENWPRFFTVMRRSVAFARLQVENRQLRRGGHLFGNTPQMRGLRARIAQIASSQASVLIHGESGTGKELVARELHRLSERGGEFTAINCAAIPEALIESELFGHVKGAHSTASEDRRGLFRAAEEGTLLLDEIGDMPLEVQAKLLRVLETRRYRPVGGDREQPMTARILAASHKDLHGEVAAGRFRQDLLYRLDVVSIEVPALRDRVADVSLLTYRFVEELSKVEGREVQQVDRDAMLALESHGWPGNVRELRNVVHRAVLLCQDGVVRRSDLVFAGGGPEGPPATPVDAGGDAFADLWAMPYRDAKEAVLERFTAQYLKHHLKNEGTVTAAAEKTGMARPNFSRLMKRYGVDSGG
jgi:DNA-binding NtrC family response regulator